MSAVVRTLLWPVSVGLGLVGGLWLALVMWRQGRRNRRFNVIH